MKYVTITLILLAQQATAQQPWTLRQCMHYAVEHNHDVRQSALQLDNYKAAKTAAVGSFLPSAAASIGAQYNFGRAIDPETNGYTDVSTFNNGYQAAASLPVFDGFNSLHALRAAKASELMGRASLRQQQDRTALAVLQAFANVAYYDGAIAMAEERLQETMLLLRQTRLLEEVGRKSAADVAQVEAQQAEADYELTCQQNLHASALLELKMTMAFPMSDSLRITGQMLEPWSDALGTTACSGSDISTGGHTELLVARYQAEASKHAWHQTRSEWFPSISLSAGINTTYYKTLNVDATQSFRQQFKNNLGEYVGVTLSIPLFSRLRTVTSVRRAKNNYRMACEAYEQKRLELEKLSREAWQDWQGYVKQTAQMERKVEADSIAYQLTRRQFEEGLSTAIDLHTTSAQLLKSKATLLQCRLMTMVKEQLVRYYRGEQIWE